METLELKTIYPDSYLDVFEKNLNSVTTLLSKLFLNEMNLYVKTRKFHWDASDKNSKLFYTLFEIQYKQLEQAIDKIAERMNDLGGKPIAVMQEFAKRSSICEIPERYASINELVKNLIENHEDIISQLLKNIEDCKDIYKDVDSADCFIGLLEEHKIVVRALKKYMD